MRDGLTGQRQSCPTVDALLGQLSAMRRWMERPFAIRKAKTDEVDNLKFVLQNACVYCIMYKISFLGAMKLSDQFFSWLKERVPRSQLSRLFLSFQELDTYCRQTGLLKVHLWETTEQSVLSKISQRIEQPGN